MRRSAYFFYTNLLRDLRFQVEQGQKGNAGHPSHYKGQMRLVINSLRALRLEVGLV